MTRHSIRMAGAILTVLLLLTGTAWTKGAHKQEAQSKQTATRSSAPEADTEATVQAIDERLHTLTLATTGGEIVDLQVSQKLLGTLAEGDRIEVSIRKTPQGQQSDMPRMSPPTSEQGP